jgi:hypothetical protein
MPDQTILIHGDVLIDRTALAAALPDAWADVLAAEVAGEREAWRQAYQCVADDWESYWADLDLSGDNSVEQWREGRWRVTRAWFRLAGQPIPDAAQSSYYLDTLAEMVGKRCLEWKQGSIDAVNMLTEAGFRIAVLDPYLPSPLVRGMLDASYLDNGVQVIGPDELEQVGMEGIEWGWFASLIGADPANMRFVSPPADLTDLVALLTHGVQPSAT